MRTFRALFTGITASALVACGGSGDGSSTDTYNSSGFSGLVAIGAAVSGAEVTVRGINGESVSGVADANGQFSLNTDGLTLPLVVEARSPNSPLTMYSYVSEGQGRVNVTPITSVLLAQAIPENQTPTSFFQSFNSSYNADFQQQLTLEQQNLQNSNVGDASYRAFDHFSGEFVANHTGYDAFLDDLDVRIYDDSVAIVQDSQLLLATPDVETMLDTQAGLDSTVQGRLSEAGGGSVALTGGVSITASDLFTGQQYTGNYNALTQEFDLSLPRFALYELKVTADGYQPVTYDHLSTFSATTNISVALVPVVSEEEVTPVDFTANVIDATTSNTAIAEATIKLRAGLNNQYGDVVYTATTDVQGAFSLSAVTPGVYTVHLSAEGFYDAYKNVAVVSSTASNQEFSLRPEFSQNIDNDAEMSIILSWGENPRDLDSHLTGPKADGSGRFHVYYSDKCWADIELNSVANCDREYSLGTYDYEFPAASVYLDRDDTSSFGPETITIKDMAEGEYNYYVHHFSGTGSIATTSQAQVVVIDKFGQEHTFYPPVGGVGDDDVWHVFKVNSNGQIIAVNNISQDDSWRPSRYTSSVTSGQTKDNLQELFSNLPVK